MSRPFTLRSVVRSLTPGNAGAPRFIRVPIMRKRLLFISIAAIGLASAAMAQDHGERGGRSSGAQSESGGGFHGGGDFGGQRGGGSDQRAAPGFQGRQAEARPNTPNSAGPNRAASTFAGGNPRTFQGRGPSDLHDGGRGGDHRRDGDYRPGYRGYAGYGGGYYGFGGYGYNYGYGYGPDYAFATPYYPSYVESYDTVDSYDYPPASDYNQSYSAPPQDDYGCQGLRWDTNQQRYVPARVACN